MRHPHRPGTALLSLRRAGFGIAWALVALLSGARPASSSPEDSGEVDVEVAEHEAPRVLATLLVEGWKAREEDIAERCAESAEESRIDPWEVVDEVVGLGAPEAAAEFAKFARTPDRAELVAYAESEAGRRPQGLARKALHAALEALAGMRFGTVELETQAAEAEKGSLLWLRQQLCLARAERARAAFPASAARFDEVSAEAVRIGARRLAATAYLEGGDVVGDELHDPGAARLRLSRGEALAARLPVPSLHGDLLASLAKATGMLGELEAAADLLGQAAPRFAEADEPLLRAMALADRGVALYRLGRYAPALEAEDAAWRVTEDLLDTPSRSEPQAWIQVWYGVIRQEMGQLDRALEHLDRARALMGRLPEKYAPTKLARLGGYVHGNRAYVLLQLERYPEAEEATDEALRLLEQCDDLAGLIAAYANAARIRAAAGDLERALAQQGAAWQRLTGSVDPVVALGIQTELADVYLAAGMPEVAETVHHGVLARATEIGLPYLRARQWTGLATARAARGDDLGATLAARWLLHALGGVVGGLGDEEAAVAREQFADAFYEGVWSARRIGDVSSMCLLTEAGRSGALLEALGGRERLREVVLPREEMAALVKVRETSRAALEVFLEALAVRKDVPARKAQYVAAEEAVAEQVARMQRRAKARVGLVYPTPDDLAGLQGHLQEGEALVLYVLPAGRAGAHALAIVVEPRTARVVDLGPGKEIADLTARLVVRPDDDYDDEAADAVAKRIVAPLGLGSHVRRLVVSPDGDLAYLPFARLAPDLVVTLVPSGTTLGALRDDRARRGPLAKDRPVLGVGGANYEVMAGGVRRDRLPWSERLSPLPETVGEVEAVAQVRLTGADATEANLGATVARLAAEGGIRSLHLAAHGRVDFERPILSYVALTAAGEDDGFLSVVEIMRLALRTDLVVLSACQSGRGGTVRGEGVYGLVRAFMVAGSPAVVASQWKVDDRATRTLMEDFYRRWTPGTSPAEALHAAQKALRGKGVPPKHWAAWVLWGLPD